MLASLVTLYGENDPDYDPEQLAIWPWVAKAAARVARVGIKVGKGIAKTAKARKAAKRIAAGAKAARAVVPGRSVQSKKTAVIPVTQNELYAARAGARSGVPVALVVAGVAGVALLLLAGGKK